MDGIWREGQLFKLRAKQLSDETQEVTGNLHCIEHRRFGAPPFRRCSPPPWIGVRNPMELREALAQWTGFGGRVEAVQVSRKAAEEGLTAVCLG